MRTLALCPALLLLLFGLAHAQQSETFGDFTVHYNALQTSELPAQVAQAYGIQRSSSRAMLNVTVLDNRGELPTPVPAEVTVSARNLTGQTRTIDMREIRETDDAIYYIGEFRVNNMETFTFQVTAEVEGRAEPIEFTFRNQFYTE